MVRYASPRTKAIFYVAVLVPMWTSYLVKVYAWRLILAKEGILSWLFEAVGAQGLLDAILQLPAIGGPSLPSSLHRHVHRVRLHVAAVHDPAHRGRAGARARVADSGVRRSRGASRADVSQRDPAAGDAAALRPDSVFTFSLTLGDYIIPSIVGAPGYFIGMMVYQSQGTAGNIPLAAAFSLVPIVLIAIYLSLVKRLGAFDAM